MAAPVEAISQEVVWKHPEVLRFARSLIHHAILAHYAGQYKFTTDIVPDEDRGDGTGVPGSCVTLLKNASLIENVGVFALGKFYADRVKSERPESKSRFISVYRLTSPGLAQEFLRRNGVQVQQRQPIIL